MVHRAIASRDLSGPQTISHLHTVVPTTYLHMAIACISKTNILGVGWFFGFFPFQRSRLSSTIYFDHHLKHPLSVESHLVHLRKYCPPKTPLKTPRLTTCQVAEGTRSGSLQPERIIAHKCCQYQRDSKSQTVHFTKT